MNSALSSYLATVSLTASGAPTSYPADATAVTVVSTILASATLTPNLGNPTNLSNYPACAVGLRLALGTKWRIVLILCREQEICSIETNSELDCDPNDVTCLCGPMSRALVAGCEEITCSADDLLSKLPTNIFILRAVPRTLCFHLSRSNIDPAALSLLAQELCDPLYDESPALSSSVSSAFASATAAAAAAVASKDPTNIASLPPCAVRFPPPLIRIDQVSEKKMMCRTS